MPGANPGTSFTYGGFIKMDGMYTDTKRYVANVMALKRQFG